MTTPLYSITVIGGGIIGLSTARALTRRGRLSLIVLEAEDRLAAHQTGHNSGVIHSGIYYKPGSLKARNCVAGREALYRFCQEHGIPHERCGKLIVATEEHELSMLEELLRRGQANGLQGVRRLDRAEIAEHEPHITGRAGLLVPETGIVDFVRVAETFADHVRQAGGVIQIGTRLRRCRRLGTELVLETNRGAIRCHYLINCGGLQCDRIARRCGVEPGLRIIPFRGEYYELVPPRRHLVRNLVYPVPDPRFPFLGVHFTRTVHGQIEAGPNAVLALRREGYAWSEWSLTDVSEMLRYAGFWRMAGKYWRTGLGEVHRSLSKRAFVKALRRLLPELRLDDIRPAGAGVRAQAVDPAGQLVDDFRILSAERMIHVLNAPSPAATASISIGQTIARMAAETFALTNYSSRG
ncbi:MAG: L-2-hydroxyglutarate oxidase [Gemmataceae bacterium]